MTLSSSSTCILNTYPQNTPLASMPRNRAQSQTKSVPLLSVLSHVQPVVLSHLGDGFWRSLLSQPLWREPNAVVVPFLGWILHCVLFSPYDFRLFLLKRTTPKMWAAGEQPHSGPSSRSAGAQGSFGCCFPQTKPTTKLSNCLQRGWSFFLLRGSNSTRAWCLPGHRIMLRNNTDQRGHSLICILPIFPGH